MFLAYRSISDVQEIDEIFSCKECKILRGYSPSVNFYQRQLFKLTRFGNTLEVLSEIPLK